MGMTLKVLGSSSAGNCYILDDGDEALIIECGIPFRTSSPNKMTIQRALDFNLKKVVGCVVTHRHGDHSKYIASVANVVRTLALPDTLSFREVDSHRAIPIEIGQGYIFGRFRVLPFEAFHDVPNVGYVIDHPDMGRLEFLTDTHESDDDEPLNWIIPGVNHLMIECNWSEKYLFKAVEEGRTSASQIKRLKVSHLSLSGTKKIISYTDMSKVSEVVLIHLSANNSDRDAFVGEIEAMTGKVTYAAKPGMEIPLIRND